jgi:hypothetical protein
VSTAIVASAALPGQCNATKRPSTFVVSVIMALYYFAKKHRQKLANNTKIEA